MMTEEDNIGALLSDVSKILIERQDEYRTGQNFNAFEMAQIGSEETRHSAIIAALLDPRGSFGKGAEPLKAFFRQVGLNDIANQCTEDTTVETEFSIAGRRMDIVISGHDFCVVIENKTTTVDHPKQLEDYRSWLDKQQVSFRELLYLTYNGEKASNYSLDTKYISISYRLHICDWLRKCALMSRENIANSVFCSQYCDFITKTLLEENKNMNESVVKISSCLDSLEKFQAAEILSMSFREIKKQKYCALFNEWLTKQEQYGHKIEHRAESDQASGFSIAVDDSELMIGFRYASGFRDLFFGLTWRDLKERPLEDIDRKYQKKDGWIRTTWWPYYKSFSADYRNPGDVLEFLFNQDKKEEFFKHLNSAFNESKVLLNEIQSNISRELKMD